MLLNLLVNILIGVLIVLLILGIIYGVIRQNKIKKDGIDAIGVVKVVKQRTTDLEFNTEVELTFHVIYKTKDGKEIDAIIGNPFLRVKDGDKIKIKYLESNPDYVVYMGKVK